MFPWQGVKAIFKHQFHGAAIDRTGQAHRQERRLRVAARMLQPFAQFGV